MSSMSVSRILRALDKNGGTVISEEKVGTHTNIKVKIGNEFVLIHYHCHSDDIFMSGFDNDFRLCTTSDKFTYGERGYEKTKLSNRNFEEVLNWMVSN